MPHVPLLWMAPLLSGGGYSSEAIAFALGLLNLTRRDATAIPTAPVPLPGSFGVRQFGEPADETFLSGLPRSDSRQLEPLFAAGWAPDAASGVVVCHSTPEAWVPSKFPGWDEVAPCPPPEAKIKVSATGRHGAVGSAAGGRSMMVWVLGREHCPARPHGGEQRPENQGAGYRQEHRTQQINWPANRQHSRPHPPSPAHPSQVGRTMFETTRLPAGWADRCNRMDEVSRALPPPFVLGWA